MSKPGALHINNMYAHTQTPPLTASRRAPGRNTPVVPDTLHRTRSLTQRITHQLILLAALATLTVVSSPAHALTDALCGQAISGTVVLTEDLDCTGHPGAPSNDAPPGTVPGAALTISSDDTTLDGSGCMATLNRNCRILAPDSAYAVYAKNKKNVTVRNVTVNGWCNGVGVYIEGGVHAGSDPGHRIVDVEANGRSYGVHIFNTSRVQVRDLTTDSASTAGLYLQSVTQSSTDPLVLRDLHLDNSLVGLLVNGFNGQNATCAGNVRACNYTFHAGAPAGLDDDANAAVLGSIKHSDTGIHFSGNVTNATVLGRATGSQDVVFNGTTAGINANAATNANLTFQDLDVSTTYGTGRGLYVSGAEIIVANVVANRREYGVQTNAVVNFTARSVRAQGATSAVRFSSYPASILNRGTGLDVSNASGTLTLVDLSLVDCDVGLRINAYYPTTPFSIGPYANGSGVITNLGDSSAGIVLDQVDNIVVENLALPNPVVGLFIVDATGVGNVGVTVRDVDASSDRGRVGLGVRVYGANHLLDRVTARARSTGLILEAAPAVRVRDLVASNNGIGMEMTGGATDLDPRFEVSAAGGKIDLTDNGIGLSFNYFRRSAGNRFVIGASSDPDPAVAANRTDLLDVSKSLVGIKFSETDFVTIRGRSFDNETYGLEIRNGKEIHLEDLDLSGHRLGTGAYIQGGSRIALINVVADRRGQGLHLIGTDALTSTNFRARSGGTGLVLWSHEGLTLPLLEGVDVRDNTAAINISGPWDARGVGGFEITGRSRVLADPARGLYGVDVGGSATGIYLINVAGFAVTDMTLANPARGIQLRQDNYLNRGLRLENLVVSGAGLGTGIDCYPNNNCVDEVTVRNVVVRQRETGVVLRGNGITIDGLVAEHNLVGLSLRHMLATGSTSTPPVIRNATLRYNDLGLALSDMPGAAATPWTLDAYVAQTATGAIASLAGNRTGIQISGGQYVRVKGLTFDSQTTAIQVPTASASLAYTFEDLTLTGRHSGPGISILSGTGHTLRNVSLTSWTKGVALDNSPSPTLDGLVVRGCSTAAVEIANTPLPLALSGLDLETSRVGLLLANIAATVANPSMLLDSTHLASLDDNAAALRVTTSPAVTVDTAGLGLVVSGTDYLDATPPSIPTLCGSTVVSDIMLSGDLDCSGLIGGNALTIGDDGVDIDLNDFKIIAPHVQNVIASNGFDDLTIHDGELSGSYPWTVNNNNGTGLRISNGHGVTLSNLTVNARDIGVLIDGQTYGTVTGLSILDLRAHGSATAGLELRGLTERPILDDLALTGGSNAGLRLATIDGGVAGWSLSAAELVDLDGNDIGILLAGAVKHVELVGPLTGLDGRRYGIQADYSTNESNRFIGLDVSSSGVLGGTGLALDGPGHVVEGLTARKRGVGLDLTRASGAEVNALAASNCTVGLFLRSFASTHDLPVITATTLTDNTFGLQFDYWTKVATFDSADMDEIAISGSTIGVDINRSQDLRFEGFTLDQRVRARSSTNLEFYGITLEGGGVSGVGLELNGTNYKVVDTTISGFSDGLYAERASALLVQNLISTGNTGSGLFFNDLRSSDIEPTLKTLTLTDNGIGLRLASWSKSYTFNNTLDTLVSTLRLDVTGSATGISAASTSNVRFENFSSTDFKTLGNRDGLSLSGSALTVAKVDVSGAGSGIGLYLSGANISVSELVAHDRGTAISTSNTPSLALSGVDANQCVTGLYLYNLKTGQAADAPTLSDLDLRANGTAIFLEDWTTPISLDGDSNLLDLGGSRVGIDGTTGYNNRPLKNITIRDFVEARSLSNPIGIRLNAFGSDGFVLEHINASGTGRGTGVELAGVNHAVRDLTISDRTTGLDIKNTSGLLLEDVTVRGAGTSALRLENARAPLTFTRLRLEANSAALVLQDVRGLPTEPIVVSAAAFATDIIDGEPHAALRDNLTSLRFASGVQYVLVRGLDLSGSLAGLDAGSIAAGSSNHHVTLDNVHATGQCRGIGVELRGQDHAIIGDSGSSELSFRGTGLRIQDGDRFVVRDSVIGSNVKGVEVLGGSAMVNTTVLARTTGANTATQVRVGNPAYLHVGQTLSVGVGTPQAQLGVISAISGDLVTFSTGLTDDGVAWIPPADTVIQSLDYQAAGYPRLTIEDSDLCANGRNSTTTYALDSGARPVITTNDYWRSLTGPTHASNPGGTGDFVTVGTTSSATGWTMPSFQSLPTDKANDYCNQAPVPAIAASPELCAGDTVVLDGTSTYTPHGSSSTWTSPDCAVPVASGDTSKELFTDQARLQGASGEPRGQPDRQRPLRRPATAARPEQRDLHLRAARRRRRHPTHHHDPAHRTAPPLAARRRGGARPGGRRRHVCRVGRLRADPDAQPLTYQWVQTAGPSVTLSDANAQSPTFDAPLVAANTTLTFTLTVTDTEPPASVVDRCHPRRASRPGQQPQPAAGRQRRHPSDRERRRPWSPSTGPSAATPMATRSSTPGSRPAAPRSRWSARTPRRRPSSRRM